MIVSRRPWTATLSKICSAIATATLLVLALGERAGVQAADYEVIDQAVVVDRSADEVWRRIGGYCAISEWMKVDCSYASGSGGVGTVRRLMNGATVEPMVAQTRHSYTYVQTQGRMAAAAFHGTLAVEAQSPSSSRLSYTLVYDAAALPSDADRRAQRERLTGRFHDLLGVMKDLCKGR
jgi:hypothetical protein